MNTKNLIRFSRRIFQGIITAILVSSCLGWERSDKSIDDSSASTPQQWLFLPGECMSDGENIQTYLDDSNCTIITVKGSSDPNNPREYFHRGFYNLARSGVTLQADGYALTSAIEVVGSNNVVRGFIINDSDSEAGIRTYGNNNLIENNEIYHMKQDGIWFFGSYNIFRGNYIHDILDPSITGDPHVDCFQTWSWNWDVVGNIIEGNICDHDRTSGSNQLIMAQRVPGDSNGLGMKFRDLTVRNNVWISHDTGYIPIALWGDSEMTGFRVVNNTFYSKYGRGDEAIYAYGMPDLYVANNASIGYGDMVRVTGGSNVNQVNNITNSPYGMEGYEGYRVERDAKGRFWIYGFHLLPNSPLVDAGAISDVEYDFDGNQRFGKPDIGAFEYH